MFRYLYNPPAIVKKMFGNFIWDSAGGKILLTFDDGPIPETTDIILKLLDKNKIKAAFFCVGNNIAKYPSLASSILEEGHVIGNHTYNHKQVTQISSEKLVEEIDSFNNLMAEKFDYKVKHFRPPHGKFNLTMGGEINKRQMSNVMWSLLTYDFKSDLNLYKKIIDKYLKHNSLVVLHDSLKSKDIIEASIMYLLEKATYKDFKIGKPEECLK